MPSEDTTDETIDDAAVSLRRQLDELQQAGMSEQEKAVAEAGLVTRVNRHQRAFGEVWEDVMRLALSLLGDARSADMSASTIWASADGERIADVLAGPWQQKEAVDDVTGDLDRRLGTARKVRARQTRQRASNISRPVPSHDGVWR